MMIGIAAVARIGAQRLAHQQAVHPRQHEIEHDQIRRRLLARCSDRVVPDAAISTVCPAFCR